MWIEVSLCRQDLSCISDCVWLVWPLTLVSPPQHHHHHHPCVPPPPAHLPPPTLPPCNVSLQRSVSENSLVAMDFSGRTGRVIDNPVEAQSAALEEGQTWRVRRGDGALALWWIDLQEVIQTWKVSTKEMLFINKSHIIVHSRLVYVLYWTASHTGCIQITAFHKHCWPRSFACLNNLGVISFMEMFCRTLFSTQTHLSFPGIPFLSKFKCAAAPLICCWDHCSDGAEEEKLLTPMFLVEGDCNALQCVFTGLKRSFTENSLCFGSNECLSMSRCDSIMSQITGHGSQVGGWFKGI